MDIGFGAAVAGAWATPRNLAELAQRAERLGYRSLWTFQRLLAPAGAKLAPVYRSVLDPMVSLGYLAAATSSIRLGVAVVNHPFQSPLLLAKQAATVDVLSGGRLDLGIGSGWLPEEFAGSGTSMAQRGARADDYVAALRALWGGAGGYQGAFFSIPAGRQDPAPVQRSSGETPARTPRGMSDERPTVSNMRTGPPILIGGMSRAAMERAGRIGDGWVTASSADLSVIAESAKVVQSAARAAGRGPARIVCRAVVRPGQPLISKTTGQRRLLSGSYERIREDIRWLESCGVTEVFYDLNFDPAVGDPAVDEGKAVLRASEILEALAPDVRM
jgi:alkanesulfonate monooxygenase SsuD/methylene tetrahydromethanopterin reductase-like flavin-dependent oxidoreductase (luciferase family)